MRKEIALPSGLKLSAAHGLYLREDDTLAVADLHLGYEASLQMEHVAIPRFQLEPMLESLRRLLDLYSPERVVINGDLKHEFSKNMGQEWDEVEELLDALSDIEVIVVRGNHDNYLRTILARRGVEMVESYVTSSGKFMFAHGHKDVVTDRYLILAHEHPMVRFVDDVGALISLPCFLHHESSGSLVMPAFSPLASGTNVLGPETGFMCPFLKGRDLSDARVYAIQGGAIWDFGYVGGLRNLNEHT